MNVDYFLTHLVGLLIFLSENSYSHFRRGKEIIEMAGDQSPVDAFEQNLALPHQFLIYLFIYS